MSWLCTIGVVWLVLDLIGLVVMAVGVKNAPLMPNEYDNNDNHDYDHDGEL